MNSSDKARRDREKGEAAERRFQSLLSKRGAPDWIKVVQRAGDDDNAKGIDFYVVTTAGSRIPVDVKSSKVGMRGHVRKHGPDVACVVVIEEGSPDEVALAGILESLRRWRERKGVL